MSSVIEKPPCPPPRVKSANTRGTASRKPKPIDYDDFSDEEEEEVVKPIQKRNKKRGEPVIPSDDDFDDDEEEEVKPKPKKKTVPKKRVVEEIDEDEDDDDDDDDDYVPPKKTNKKPTKPAQTKRPATAQVNKKKVQPIEEDDDDDDDEDDDDNDDDNDNDNQGSVDDYEGGDEDEILAAYNAKKKNQLQIIKTNQRTHEIQNQQKKPAQATKKPAQSSTNKKSASTTKKSTSQPAKQPAKKPANKPKQQVKSSIVNVPQQQYTKYTKQSSEIGQIILGNIGKQFGVKDKKQLNNAKSKLADLFATKKTKKIIETETDDSTKKDDDDNEESKMEDKKDPNFTNFLSEINNLNYTGYNYKLKESDYFVNNGKKYNTILNSEDAAIKKCEELYKSLGEKEAFFDTEFGSLPGDGGKLNKYSLYSSDPVPAGNPNPSLIEWYSINQISPDAKFFDDGTESNDVVQGSLGDCWFVSALSVIATKDYLLRGEFSPNILDDGIIDDEENMMMSTGVYPPIFHSFRKKGIFCFKFFKNFQWRYVIVDDRLPCQKIFNKNQTPTLLYGKCRSRNEFWVPLIEKGYAKLHGSYRSLVSGFIDDGLVDLTGLTAKKIMIDPKTKNDTQKVEDLWKLLMENSTMDFGNKSIVKDSSGKKITAKYFTRNKSMMGCSVDPTGNKVEMEVILENQHTGVLAGHAYSILDCFEIPKPSSRKPRKTSRLLRIRNPWGRKEWVGKWCDDSEEVIANEKKIREALNKKYEGTNEKISVNTEDGTFIMCYSDFRKIFNKLFICVNFPPDYVGIRYYGAWTNQETGGLPINNTQQEYEDFCKNPQFYLEKENDGKTFISLLQKDGRLTGTKFPFANAVRKACLLVFRTKNRQRITDLSGMIEKTLIVQRRDLNLELDLPRGEYIIMAATLKKGELGDFCIEVFTQDKILKKSSEKDPFTFDKLKYTKMEKLGGDPGRFELVSDSRGDQIGEAREEKKKFIMAQFQNCLKDDDDTNYANLKQEKPAGTKNDDDDDDNYDDSYDEF